MITFIVSAFNRPKALNCCLASLALQAGNNHIIVADNTTSSEISLAHQKIAVRYSAHYIRTSLIFENVHECYDAAEAIINSGIVKTPWICFPSDDSYYVPMFAEIMLKHAELNNWDFVYCDMVYGRVNGDYGWFPVAPWPFSIDKTGFILKRDKFNGFPNKPGKDAPANCDGFLAQELVGRGVRHGKAPGVLVVHN